ncbi:MAG: beta/gamma crystallin-related protein [Burkholderiaceae bacterium]
MKHIFKTTVAMLGLAFAAQAMAQISFYENEEYSGRSFTTYKQIGNFQRFGFNDLASSAVVSRDRWEVCEDIRFGGNCVVLRRGNYPSLRAMGLNNRVSSVRMVSANAQINDERYAPQPAAVYDSRRRNNERLYQANVTSVRAVVGTPTQRCWIEQEQVNQNNNNRNVPGAVVGAVLGGILGHQVGGGRGKDFATVGGAVAGGYIGSNVGRDGNGQQTYSQNVQRCANVPNQTPDYWDVTYNFRNQEYRLQMTTPPGQTVTVNNRGEPRA